MLNEKALEAAKKAVKASAIYNPAGDVSSLARPALEAYFRSLPSSPVSELVKRLRSAVGYSPYIGYALVSEAADRLTALEAENAQLRGHIVEAQKILCEPQDEIVRLVRATITLAQALTAPQGDNHA